MLLTLSCVCPGTVALFRPGYNNIDDDGDGLIDKEDPDCIRCGDGVVDAGEDCDDGNMLDGDGCSSVGFEKGPCHLPVGLG